MASDLIGLPIGEIYTVISDEQVLNKIDGSVSKIEDILPLVQISSSLFDTNAVVAKQVEIVVGVEGKKIDFILATSEGILESNNGYLIEVYVSGSDGKLTRVYQEDVVDVINDTTLSEGFSNYLVLQTDVEE